MKSPSGVSTRKVKRYLAIRDDGRYIFVQEKAELLALIAKSAHAFNVVDLQEVKEQRNG